MLDAANTVHFCGIRYADPAQCLYSKIYSPTKLALRVSRPSSDPPLDALSLCQLHLFISLSAAVPEAHHHAVAQSPLIGSALLNSVRHPFFDSSVLLNSPLLLVLSSPYYLPILLPLAVVAWPSFRHRSAILCLFALLYCPLSSSRFPTSVPGLFVSFLAVALLLYTSYFLSFSSFSSFSRLFVRSWVRMSSLTAVLPPSSRALFQSIPP